MEQQTSIEELNLFFSNISYDFYNLHMAVIIAYYNNNFSPLTQKEIYNEIISRKDFRDKLRKSTGEKYSSIKLRIKDILKKKKSIFKNLSKSKRTRGAKYAIVLNQVTKFRKSQASHMNKDINTDTDEEDLTSTKFENKKKYSEDKLSNKKDNNINYILNEKPEQNSMNELLSKKTKRKKYKCDNNTNNSSDMSGYKTVYKINKPSKNNIIMTGYLTDDINKTKYNNNNNDNDNDNENGNDLLKDIFKNSIYDKLPQIDENSINNTIENYGKLIEKLDTIRKNLINFKNNKILINSFTENKKKEEKEKLSISNYVKNFQKLLNENKFNSDVFERQNDLFKKNVDDYLEIYEDSYEILFKIIYERNELFDGLILEG